MGEAFADLAGKRGANVPRVGSDNDEVDVAVRSSASPGNGLDEDDGIGSGGSLLRRPGSGSRSDWPARAA
jgi:hypothetical protein